MFGSDQQLNIIIKAKDQASATLDKFRGKLESMQPAFQKMAAIGTASFAAITAVAIKSVNAYAEVERANRQLEHAVIGVSKGTAEQVKQLGALAQALEKKAGIDADSLKMGIAQLSTFGLQTKSVIDLSKSLADLTVNQNGLNATSDQYIASANIMAKAMRGEFGMLQKMGIRFTEAQQKLIKFGTETEKVAALQEGLAQNLRETTDTVAGVDLATAKLKRGFENIQENIGGALAGAFATLLSRVQPVVDKFAEWVENNPQLVANIVLAAGAVSGLVAVIGFLGLALPAIIAGFGLLLSPIVLVVAAVATLVAGFIIFRDKIGEILEYIDERTFLITAFKEAWDAIYTTFTENLLPALQQLWEALKPLEPVLTLLAKIIGAALLGAVLLIVRAITGWVQIITNIIALATEFATAIIQGFTKPIEGFIQAVKDAVAWVQRLIDKMAQVAGAAGGKLKSVGNFLVDKVGGGINGLLGREHGGRVPGPVGTAVPIIAHGGEEIIPASRARSGGGASIILNLNYPQFRDQDDVNVVKEQLEKALRDVTRIYKIQIA